MSTDIPYTTPPRGIAKYAGWRKLNYKDGSILISQNDSSTSVRTSYIADNPNFPEDIYSKGTSNSSRLNIDNGFYPVLQKTFDFDVTNCATDDNGYLYIVDDSTIRKYDSISGDEVTDSRYPYVMAYTPTDWRGDKYGNIFSVYKKCFLTGEEFIPGVSWYSPSFWFGWCELWLGKVGLSDDYIFDTRIDRLDPIQSPIYIRSQSTMFTYSGAGGSYPAVGFDFNIDSLGNSVIRTDKGLIVCIGSTGEIVYERMSQHAVISGFYPTSNKGYTSTGSISTLDKEVVHFGLLEPGVQLIEYDDTSDSPAVPPTYSINFGNGITHGDIIFVSSDVTVNGGPAQTEPISSSSGGAKIQQALRDAGLSDAVAVGSQPVVIDGLYDLSITNHNMPSEPWNGTGLFPYFVRTYGPIFKLGVSPCTSSGTFKLKTDNITTDTIPYNATARQVELALQNAGVSGFTVAGVQLNKNEPVTIKGLSNLSIVEEDVGSDIISATKIGHAGDRQFDIPLYYGLDPQGDNPPYWTVRTAIINHEGGVIIGGDRIFEYDIRDDELFLDDIRVSIMYYDDDSVLQWTFDHGVPIATPIISHISQTSDNHILIGGYVVKTLQT